MLWAPTVAVFTGRLVGSIAKVGRQPFFDVSRKSSTYGCNAENSELNFRSTPAGIKYVGQYSHGSYNHISYNVPAGSVQFIVEFFESLENALYAEPETNQALIPFVAGRFSEAFTDNIHLCHRVSDPQGNTTYKLMHLDLGGPAIKLTLVNDTLQASSPAVDLDDSTWQYYKLPHRRNRYICDYLDYPPEPTGKTATVANVKNGDWYCFWVLDTQGNRNTRLIEVDSSTEPETILPPVVDTQEEAVVINPPEESVPEQTEQTRDDDDDASLLTGQQSHSAGRTGGNNGITPGNTDEPEEQAVVQQQPDQAPSANQEQPQITFEETLAEEQEQEVDVALQSADDNVRSAGQVLPQDSETPAVLRYLMFILAGLVAAAIVLTLICLKTAPRRK